MKPGPPRQRTPTRRQNRNNRSQHPQIQPIKRPAQNNEIPTRPSTGDVHATTASVKFQAQTSSNPMRPQPQEEPYAATSPSQAIG